MWYILAGLWMLWGTRWCCVRGIGGQWMLPGITQSPCIDYLVSQKPWEGGEKTCFSACKTTIPVIRSTGISDCSISTTNIRLVTEQSPPPLYKSPLSFLPISYPIIRNPGFLHPIRPSCSPIPCASSGEALSKSMRFVGVSYILRRVHIIRLRPRPLASTTRSFDFGSDMRSRMDVWNGRSVVIWVTWWDGPLDFKCSVPGKKTCPNHNQRRLTPPVFIRKRHSKLITRSQTISDRGGEWIPL